MRISDWSSDVCSSDLTRLRRVRPRPRNRTGVPARTRELYAANARDDGTDCIDTSCRLGCRHTHRTRLCHFRVDDGKPATHADRFRSEEHTSELQSLMRISYAVFCLKKKKNQPLQHHICDTYTTHSERQLLAP